MNPQASRGEWETGFGFDFIFTGWFEVPIWFLRYAIITEARPAPRRGTVMVSFLNSGEPCRSSTRWQAVGLLAGDCRRRTCAVVEWLLLSQSRNPNPPAILEVPCTNQYHIRFGDFNQTAGFL